MLTAYLVALSFGAVLLGAGMLFGGGDHDTDHDLDADHDFDTDLSATSHSTAELAGDAAQGILFNPLLSIRFWTYFSAGFGGLGTVLYFAGLPTAIHAPLALGFGGLVGYGVAGLFRALRRSTVTSATHASSLSGNTARVLLNIHPGGTGKVRIRQGDMDHDLMARCHGDQSLPVGSEVLVVSIEEGVARVEALPSADMVDNRESSPSSAHRPPQANLLPGKEL